MPNPEHIGEGPVYKPGNSRGGNNSRHKSGDGSGNRKPFGKKKPFKKNKPKGDQNRAKADSPKTEVKKKFYPKRPPTQTGHLQKD